MSSKESPNDINDVERLRKLIADNAKQINAATEINVSLRNEVAQLTEENEQLRSEINRALSKLNAGFPQLTHVGKDATVADIQRILRDVVGRTNGY
jgi:predicted RNase H-like nuclease (RuvC/YqgF family)